MLILVLLLNRLMHDEGLRGLNDEGLKGLNVVDSGDKRN
jgi:hypothetical protein